LITYCMYWSPHCANCNGAHLYAHRLI